MKRLILAGILLISLAMAMSPLTAAYNSSQRDTIRVVSGSMQASLSIPGALFYDGNVTLPWKISDFNQTYTKISFHFLGPVTMTGGFWNERVFGADTYDNEWVNETLYMSLNQGGSNNMTATDTWSHINVTANNTDWEMTVYYYLDTVATINGVITYTEADKADPKVGSFWGVNDTLTFGTLPFDMELYLKLSYPSTVVGTPNLYPWNGTEVGSGDAVNAEYQKYGPAHDLDENDVDGTAGSVTATFESDDKLEGATWDITFTDEAWNGIFATAASPVTVKVNGDTVKASDVELTANKLAISNIDIDNSDNTVTFAWATSGTGTGTTPTTPPATATDILTQEAISGVPNWAVIGVALIVVVAGIAIWKNEKKK